MWAGTREGLSYYDPATRIFRTFRMEAGLPDNTIVSILEDDNGYLWVSTTRGLSRVRATGKGSELVISCRNYDEQDGLQGKVFNVNAALRLRSGEMLFGGADGFNLFNPAEIRESKTPPHWSSPDCNCSIKPLRLVKVFAAIPCWKPPAGDGEHRAEI